MDALQTDTILSINLDIVLRRDSSASTDFVVAQESVDELAEAIRGLLAAGKADEFHTVGIQVRAAAGYRDANVDNRPSVRPFHDYKRSYVMNRDELAEGLVQG